MGELKPVSQISKLALESRQTFLWVVSPGLSGAVLSLDKLHSLRFQIHRACFRLPSVGGGILSRGIHAYCSYKTSRVSGKKSSERNTI